MDFKKANLMAWNERMGHRFLEGGNKALNRSKNLEDELIVAKRAIPQQYGAFWQSHFK